MEESTARWLKERLGETCIACGSEPVTDENERSDYISAIKVKNIPCDNHNYLNSREVRGILQQHGLQHSRNAFSRYDFPAWFNAHDKKVYYTLKDVKDVLQRESDVWKRQAGRIRKHECADNTLSGCCGAEMHGDVSGFCGACNESSVFECSICSKIMEVG
jgi:hypothetical protein